MLLFTTDNAGQPLYNKCTICGVQVSYPTRIWVKYIGYIEKEVLNSNLASNPDLCYIQKLYYNELCYEKVQVREILGAIFTTFSWLQTCETARSAETHF